VKSFDLKISSFLRNPSALIFTSLKEYKALKKKKKKRGKYGIHLQSCTNMRKHFIFPQGLKKVSINATSLSYSRHSTSNSQNVICVVLRHGKKLIAGNIIQLRKHQFNRTISNEKLIQMQLLNSFTNNSSFKLHSLIHIALI
jgi:hypothetical protein